MPAPTAAAIIKALARQRYQSEMAQLAELDGMHGDAVRMALSAVPPSARIDLGILIRSVRNELKERAEADAARRAAADPLAAWRYELDLRSPGELLALRDELRARVDRGEGGAPFRPGSAVAARLDAVSSRTAPTYDDVEPDDEPEERPRSRPRIWSRRAGTSAGARTAAGRGQTRPEPVERAQLRPSGNARLVPRLIGGAGLDRRPYGAALGLGSDYDAWLNPAKPPWLISEDEEAEEEVA